MTHDLPADLELVSCELSEDNAVMIDEWIARSAEIVRDVGAMRLARSTDFKFDTDQIAYRVTLRSDIASFVDQ